ncbi:hypothetical protein KEM60_00998 [Austwickia sp. TVS 96-490-7B]|uniref:DMT family transporter n=1 Tax=Austwickia sp. TVS 96-490-7B TaxID=2830843 RepID=UPI001C58BB2A|nr:DMT family transporter [Austwickia sp. TVS 96-490-7B]MBW3084809.1 hypothetical protein [Austwickia sp. TVS 96-490-7B]
MEALFASAVALLSAVGYGISDFAGGMLSRHRAAMAVVGVSQACSLVILVIAVAFLGIPPSTDWLPWAVLAGFAGSAGLVLFYRALAVGTVGVVSPISATGAVIPVFIAIAAGERPSMEKLAGIILALTGAILASGPELRGEPHVKARAIWYAAGAALGFGIAIYAIARGSESSTLMTMLGMRTTSVTSFALAALVTRSVGGVRRRDLPALALLGAGDMGANLLFGVAATKGMLSVTSVLSSLYPVVTVGLAAVILHERMRPVQIAGVVTALAGVALIALPG